MSMMKKTPRVISYSRRFPTLFKAASLGLTCDAENVDAANAASDVSSPADLPDLSFAISRRSRIFSSDSESCWSRFYETVSAEIYE
jgi:hypothetical protein